MTTPQSIGGYIKERRIARELVKNQEGQLRESVFCDDMTKRFRPIGGDLRFFYLYKYIHTKDLWPKIYDHPVSAFASTLIEIAPYPYPPYSIVTTVTLI